MRREAGEATPLGRRTIPTAAPQDPEVVRCWSRRIHLPATAVDERLPYELVHARMLPPATAVARCRHRENSGTRHQLQRFVHVSLEALFRRRQRRGRMAIASRANGYAASMYGDFSNVPADLMACAARRRRDCCESWFSQRVFADAQAVTTVLVPPMTRTGFPQTRPST
jgi:hypothetical protein